MELFSLGFLSKITTLPAVVPVLLGPLQALMAVLPAILVAMGAVIVSLFKPTMMKRMGILLWHQKFMVLLLAGVIYGFAQIVGTLSWASGTVAEKEISSTDWSLFRGGIDRRGYVHSAKDDPAHGKVQWSFVHDGFKWFCSSPSVVGNRVYATSARWEPFKKDGAIYSIDADTSEIAWMYKDSGYRATFSSPAVSGKYLVVGEGLHLTKDARVFCIDVEQSEKQRKGIKLWEYRTNSHVESSPCIAPELNRVFVGAGDDGLYCLQLEPENGQTKVLWHKEGKDYPDCETSPVYHEGRVYFGLGLGGQAIVCLDAKTGKELWRAPTPYPVFSSPTLSNGKLLAGMGWGDFVNKAEAMKTVMADKLKAKGKSESDIKKITDPIHPAGAVWCIDLNPKSTSGKATGFEITWKFPVSRTVLGSVAVHQDNIYFSSRDKHVYCVSVETGKLVKRRNVRETLVTSPSVAKEHVYVVTEGGRLVGLEKRGLSAVWEVGLNSPNLNLSSPVVARGHVYVGSGSNGLLCIGKPGREKSPAIWAGSHGGPGMAGSRDRSMITESGGYKWSAFGEDKTKPWKISAPSAYVNGAFYVACESPKGLVKLMGKEDSEKKGKWNIQAGVTEQWFKDTPNAIQISPASTEKAVFIVDGVKGERNRNLYCLSPDNGKTLWKFPLSNGSGHFILEGDKLIITDSSQTLTCLNIKEPQKEPTIQWRVEQGTPLGEPAIAADILVASFNDITQIKTRGLLAFIDLESGKILRKQTLASIPQTGPVKTGGRIWVGLQNELRAFDIAHSKDTGGNELELSSEALIRMVNTTYGKNFPTEAAVNVQVKDNNKRRTLPGLKVIVKKSDRVPVRGVHNKLLATENRLACLNAEGDLIIIDSIAGQIVKRFTNTAGMQLPLLTDDALLYAANDNNRYSIQRHDLRTDETKRWAKIGASFPGLINSPLIMVDSHVVMATDKRGLVCMRPKK